MPFEGTYKNKVEKGDLVYGLATPRGQFLDEKVGEDWKKSVYVIDQFEPHNTAFLAGCVDASREDQKSFRETLDNKKNRHHKPILATGHKRELTEQEKLKQFTASNEFYNPELRGKSKLGVYWAIFVKKTHIHFVLDGIDHKEVAGKARQGEHKNDDGKFRTVTGSELRWIYRHRGNKTVKDRVQFWEKKSDKFECTGPPWCNEKWKSDWATYQPNTENVHHDCFLDI